MARELRNGTTINGYRIDGVLSEAGNFSVVYLAYDLDTPRVERRRERVAGRLGRWRDRYGSAAAETMLDVGPAVALKEYIPKLYGHRQGNGVVSAAPGEADIFAWGRERFTRESMFLSEHSHPNVVAIYDRFSLLNTEYYVMERLVGGSLDDLLKRTGPQNEAQVRSWLQPLLEGLASIERRDANHLDLSPGNVMFRTVGGDPVIVDFGASRIGGSPPLHSSHFFVDDHFAAPEKYKLGSSKLNARSDVYSLGAIINYALSGELPAKANERLANAGQSQGLSADGLRRRAQNAGSGFLRVADRAFAPDAAARFEDAGAMALALSKGARATPQQSQNDSSQGRVAAQQAAPLDERKRRLAIIIMVVAGLIALLMLAATIAATSSSAGN